VPFERWNGFLSVRILSIPITLLAVGYQSLVVRFLPKDYWVERKDAIYKGHHETEMPYLIARQRILERAEPELANGPDAQYWQEARELYQGRTTLTSLSDYRKHYEYAEGVMGDSIEIADRIWSSIKASVFSPFNGFT
jgi:hypothetical protein